jgi:uncharacterized protein (DUF1015 family)
MALLETFAAARYDRSRVELDDVVSPPYDVVSPQERDELARKSPYNSVRVELPMPDARAGLDRYENAARIFSGWLGEGVVGVDERPGLYVYRMTFTDEHGRHRTSTGVLGALGLDLEHTGQVLPHEQTMPKDRHDRLSLLRATNANLSPIWGLSLASGFTDACREALESAEDKEPWRATDPQGVVHECWRVSDETATARITTVAASAPVLIADGHHRYDTACAYAEERRAEVAGSGAPSSGGGAGVAFPAGATAGTTGAARPAGYELLLALVVELSVDELSVGAIHRLVSGLPPVRLVEQLEAFYEPRPAPEEPTALVRAMNEEGGIGLVTRGERRVLVPRPSLVEATDDDLDSVHLKHALDTLGDYDVVYQPGFREAITAVETGRAEVAFLLRPVSVGQIERVAHGGRRMPPKTTFFQPKPRTGMVFRPLGQ